MGTEEEGTHERLKAHRSELIDPKIREHHGRIVKTTGDGMLAEFASVIDAVRCAAELQRAMIDSEAGMLEDRRIRFRVGINLGDVIVEHDDIFGDGVNVAARLEALSDPGGICISRVVRDQIRDKLPYTFEDLGEQTVKNIARPVRVYALRPEAIAALPAPTAQTALPIFQRAGAPRLSIVVLPFANLSNDPEQQYFADGITEDLTTDLSRLADMLVISRNTAFTYQGKRVDTKQIGRELGVRYVLEGSVRRSGNRIRINAQLIDAETDTHLWAERFDGDTNNLLALQDEITSRIAVALNLELLSAEAARTTERPDVRDYILRARAAWNNPPARGNYLRVIDFLEHALMLDPRSVDAQSWLAAVLAARVMNAMSDTPAADIQRAEDLAAQALAASPRGPLAHWAKGQVLRAQNRFDEAIPEYEAVIASNRNFPHAIAALGSCKYLTGSMEEALLLQEQAIRISPRDPLIWAYYERIGRVHLLQSRIDEAIPWFEKARGAHPVHWLPHANLAAACALEGDAARATAELAEARRLNSDDRLSSIARLKAMGSFGGLNVQMRALFETTFFAGLRLAGMPEE
jgi:TolB-like protein/Tfp pilus assembly protein PilF